MRWWTSDTTKCEAPILERPEDSGDIGPRARANPRVAARLEERERPKLGAGLGSMERGEAQGAAQ